jgi:hypothetical protein
MRLPSSPDERNKAIALGAGAVILAVIVYVNFRDPGPTPTPVRPAVATSAGSTAGRPAAKGTGSAKAVAKTGAGLDPTLHMEAMLVTEAVEYEGSGRNIFSANSAPVQQAKIEAPVGPARLTGQGGPPPPHQDPPPLPTCPPTCPPIPLKFFGLTTGVVNGNRRAFLLHEDDVFLASQGDVVLRRYRVVTMSANSIEVEDMTNGNKQTLPLQAN